MGPTASDPPTIQPPTQLFQDRLCVSRYKDKALNIDGFAIVSDNQFW